MTDKEESIFDRLSKIDVSKHVEKKMGLSYLSWSWAWAYLKALYGNDVTRSHREFDEYDFNEHKMTGRKIDYMMTRNGAYVECTVTIQGHAETETLPVMDYKNKSVANPDQMQVNKAIQRCFVKACALQGLGLNIYAGEDLPIEPSKQTAPKQANNQRTARTNQNANNQPQQAKVAPMSKVNMLVQLISTYAKGAGKDEHDTIIQSCKRAGVQSLNQLNEPQVDELIKGFTKAIEILNEKKEATQNA